jgi:hypothetical protein
LKKDGREFEAIFLATLENGAGNVADQVLRNFYREYMNTISFFGLTGLKRLPDSINIMEAFFDYDIIFRVRPELDYLISIEDFFDYVTSSDSPNIDLSSACKMKEGYIYNYTAYDDPKSCMFTMNDGHDYAICGLSMIRREDELSIMLVVGKAYTEDDKNKTINMAKNFFNFKSMKRADKEYAEITNFDNIEWDIKQPSNANGLWQHTVLIRFNLKEKNYSERYVLINLSKSSYYVKDDDTFSLEKQNSNINIKSSFNIHNYTTLFEIAKTCVLMPSYIDYRFTFIKPENRQTKLINNLSKSPKKKIN